MPPEKKSSRAKTAAKKQATSELRTDAQVMTALNQAESAAALIKAVGLSKTHQDAAASLLAHRATLNRTAFTTAAQLSEAAAANPRTLGHH